MPSPELSRTRLCTKEFKGNIGPCMISFSIPLLIPGLTITLVAFADETGFSKYGGLHVLGMVILAMAILLFIMGCVFRCFFQIIRVAPLDSESLRTVTTHDKLNLIDTDGVGRETDKTVVDVNKTNYASTSTSSRDHNQNRKKSEQRSDNVSYSTSETESYCTDTDSDGRQTDKLELGQEDRRDKGKLSDDIRGEQIHLDPSLLDTQDDSDTNTDLYPLKRLPKIDLKHTKFSYSSQDKPDEEMSIIDETKSVSPDDRVNDKRHLGDLPDLNVDRGRRVLSDGSCDTNSYTSSDSISGHIIRTNPGVYHNTTETDNF